MVIKLPYLVPFIVSKLPYIVCFMVSKLLYMAIRFMASKCGQPGKENKRAVTCFLNSFVAE